MIDQSHNLKGKIEATVQTVVTAQELWLKARSSIASNWPGFSSPATWWPPRSFSAAHSGAMCARWRAAWREARGLPADPLAALREGGYVERISRERGRRTSAVNSYA